MSKLTNYVKKYGFLPAAIAILGMTNLAVATQPVMADAPNAAENTFPALWQGQDGDCDWSFDIVSRTLTIKSGAAGQQLSRQPLSQLLQWADLVEHIKFSTPVTMAINSGSKFAGLQNLQSIDGFDQVATDRVVNMSSLFDGDADLTSIDLSKNDTSRAVNMSNMFNGDQNLTSLNLTNFNTNQVTNMAGMFSGTSMLKQLDVSHFDTGRVTDMSSMFSDSAAEKLDLSHFDTHKVTNMSGMFNRCAVSELDLSNFDTSQVTSMSDMFMGSQVKSLDLSHFDTSQVSSIYGMFASAKNLTSLDLHNFNTSQVVNMEGMFASDTNLKSLNLTGWDTRKVTNTSDMFQNCSSLAELNLSNFYLPNVKETYGMFQYDYELTQLDLSHFNQNNAGILANAGAPARFAVTLGDYALSPKSQVGQGFKSIQAVGKGTIANPKGKKYTAKQLLNLYSDTSKKRPVETYVMTGGTKTLPKQPHAVATTK